MNLQSFIELLSSKVSETLGPGYEVTPRKILKNNSVEFDCLSISHEKTNIAPNIRINNIYHEFCNGQDIDMLVKKVLMQYRDCLSQIEDTDYLHISRENAEERIILRLVNYARNQRILENCPHDRILDLAVTYHYMVSNDPEHGLSTARIDYTNINYFNLTEESLRRLARKNTENLFPPLFEKIEHMIMSFMKEHFKDTENELPFLEDMIPMYVLTTDQRINGAACILYDGMLERIKKSLGSDFYIIPSSINEVLIIPSSAGMTEYTLNDMLRSVNREQVPDTEILSDNIYHYPKDSFNLA